MQGAGGGGDDNRKRKMPEVPEDKLISSWIEDVEEQIIEYLAGGALGTIPTKHHRQITFCEKGMKKNKGPQQGGFKYKTEDAKEKHLFVQNAIRRLAESRLLLRVPDGNVFTTSNLMKNDVEVLMMFLPAALRRREAMYAALHDDSEEDEGEDPNGPC